MWCKMNIKHRSVLLMCKRRKYQSIDRFMRFLLDLCKVDEIVEWEKILSKELSINFESISSTSADIKKIRELCRNSYINMKLWDSHRKRKYISVSDLSINSLGDRELAIEILTCLYNSAWYLDAFDFTAIVDVKSTCSSVKKKRNFSYWKYYLRYHKWEEKDKKELNNKSWYSLNVQNEEAFMKVVLKNKECSIRPLFIRNGIKTICGIDDTRWRTNKITYKKLLLWYNFYKTMECVKYELTIVWEFLNGQDKEWELEDVGSYGMNRIRERGA